MKNSKSSETLRTLYENIMSFLSGCSEIKPILFYGSLLGYHRENNFINNDDDIDIILNQNDFDILQNYINNNIINYSNIKLKTNKPNFMQLYCNNIGPFDIFAFNTYDTHIYI